MNNFHVEDISGTTIASNLDKTCKKCYLKCDSQGVSQQCKKTNSSVKYGKIKNKNGITFLCCSSTKTTKLFRQKLEALSYAYYDLVLPRINENARIKETIQKRVNRLVHNLTSINAHNIQEIYDLVPQDVLASDFNHQIEKIQDEITSDPHAAALAFIRIAKHNIHMKSEFSIYKKLERANPSLDRKSHIIHKVLMNILHTFFVDFSDKDVFVNVQECRAQILFDYETIQVALYHIIENAAKYVKPKSEIQIEFDDSDEKIDVIFKMTSHTVFSSEIEKIFEEGYSGKEAKKASKQGDGIGLWRAQQMLGLNQGKVMFEAGDVSEQVLGFNFSENKIIIRINKY